MTNNAVRRNLRRAILAAVSLLASLAVAELALRSLVPHQGLRGGRELTEFRTGGESIRDVFELDPEMGFRPRVPSAAYNRFGTLPNDYPPLKRPGVERWLFVGDSVTARGRLVAAIRRACGEDRREYWNAGVEGFNTLQELHFFRRFNKALQPDRVILTFHLNDFETTPVSFLDAEGRLVVYAPNRPAQQVNGLLFKHVHLYRLWLGATTGRGRGFEAFAAEVRTALAAFATEVAPARLTVLVFPYLKPHVAWGPRERQAHATISAILDELRIEALDLSPLAEAALQQGIALQESPGDFWHPSDAFAEFAVERLCRDGRLGERCAAVATAASVPALPR